MARRNNDKELKEVMEQLYKAYGWTEKMDGVKVMNTWDKVVGNIIANHTTNLYVKNKILYVILDSSVLRNELYMERSNLVKKINDEIGKKVITEIIFN